MQLSVLMMCRYYYGYLGFICLQAIDIFRFVNPSLTASLSKSPESFPFQKVMAFGAFYLVRFKAGF